MKTGDLVKIVRDPISPAIATVGRVGVIERLHDDGKALIQFIKAPGDAAGAAFVPTDCLEVTNDPALVDLLAAYRRAEAEAEQKLAEWRRQRRRDIEAVAQKYRMSVEQVLEITEAVIGDDAHVYY